MKAILPYGVDEVTSLSDLHRIITMHHKECNTLLEHMQLENAIDLALQITENYEALGLIKPALKTRIFSELCDISVNTTDRLKTQILN